MNKYHGRWRKERRPSLSVISVAVIAFGRSCLFAITRRTASLSSSYLFVKQTKISFKGNKKPFYL